MPSLLRHPMRHVALIALVAGIVVLAWASEDGRSLTPPPNRPNVLLVVSDDQPTATFTRQHMPRVFADIVDQGVEFSRAYVNSPLCCPSRSEIMTGLFEHNTGVDENNVQLTRPTVVELLKDMGYRTMLAGKYLNSMPCTPRREFDEWVCYGPNPSTYSMVDPLLNVNGTWTQHTGYTTDILASRVASFVQSTPADQPFFALVAPTSPHVPADDDRCFGIPVPPNRPPSFDANPWLSGKPSHMRRPPLTAAETLSVDTTWTRMSQAVTCLDTSIGTILDALGPRAADTLVVYVSDNGYLNGEHRRWAKQSVYEESIRVPLAIRFPRLGTTPRSTAALVQTTDLAPTIAGLLGVSWAGDGKSLVPLLDGTATTLRNGVLIERCQGATYPCEDHSLIHGGQGAVPSFSAVVRDQYKYVRYITGETELYDLVADPYELTNLAGSPALATTQAALAGHLTFLRGLQPPNTTILAGPAGAMSTERVFTTRYFTQSRRAVYECRLDRNGVAGAWSSCNDEGLTIGPLDDGAYDFRVRGINEAGTVDDSPAVTSFTVSSTGPTARILTGPAPDSASRTATFTFSSTTAGATFQCRLEPFGTRAAWAPCASGIAYPSLADGHWRFVVRAVDSLGRVTSNPAVALFRVNLTGPTMVADHAPASPTPLTDARFVFHPVERTTGPFTCRLDAQLPVDCSRGAFDAAGLADGAHTLQVTATDLGGGSGTTTFAWVVDATPPTITQTLAPVGGWTNWTGANFAFTTSQAPGAFWCSIDSAFYKPCGATWTHNGLVDGPHTHSAIVLDDAGNASAPVTTTWTQDTVLPVVTVTGGPTGVTPETTATFGLAVDEAGATLRCQLDAQAPRNCTPTTTFTALTAGAHTFSAWAIDAAKNRSATITRTWTVDVAPPVATIETGPVGLVAVRDATFTLSSSKPGTFRCATDGAAEAACDATVTLTGLGDGAHELTVVALDTAGTRSLPVTRAWTVDATAPTAAIVGGPSGTVQSTTATFTLTSSEPGTFACSVDGAPEAPCASPLALSGLGDGSHGLSLVAIDAAGNRSTAVSRAWTVRSCVGGTLTLTATGDSWVQQDRPTATAGGDGSLQIRSESGKNRRALVQFATPAIPAGCAVTSASLRVFASSASTGRTLLAQPVGAAWTENGVTWANQPGATGTPATTPSGTGQRSFDVTTQVQAMIAGANFGFVVRDAAESSGSRQSQTLAARTVANPPTLVVVYG